MHNWLGIALVAYLIGASIEGINTARHLSHSLPELVKGTEDDSKESPATPHGNGLVFTIIAAVSFTGALCWPCRLIHRSMKQEQNSLDT